MAYLIGGLIAACCVSIPMHFEKNWFLRLLGMFALSTTVFAIFLYIAAAPFVGPFGGWVMIFPVLMGLIIRTVVTFLLYDIKGDDESYYPFRVAGLLFGVGMIFLILPSVLGSAMLRSDEYHDMAGKDVVKSDWKSDMTPIDDAHIRLVSQGQAEWKARQQLGQNGTSLGSKYQLGELSVQKVGNELVWVGALEFQGYGSWSSYDTTPGFVMVNAEDPNAVPKLVTGHAFRYMTSAYFSDDVRRHVFANGYQFKGTTDYTFEVDDELHPFWVVSVYTPTIGFWGESITEVLLVDPTTGDIQSFAPNKVPDWVDRVVPENFVHERLVDRGQYVHGWKNSLWGHGDIVVPTLHDLKLVWTDNGNAQWFTGLTSPTNSDQALVGFALTDSRTGVVREYILSGSNEDAVDNIVNKSISNFAGYTATQPILYNIYGELTWVVPVVSGGIFQRVALVRATNGTVVLGNNKHEALAAYRKLLTSAGNSDVPSASARVSHETSEVKRFSFSVTGGETTFYLTAGNSPHIFSGTTVISPLLPLALVGDRVRITYEETNELVVPMTKFEALIPGLSALSEDVTPVGK